MKLSSLAVKRPVAVLMAVLTVILLGVVSLSKLTVDLYPKMTFPIAVVIANYPGSAPEEVENLLTRPLEETLGTVNNVKEIRSFSQPGSSMVMVEFNWGTDMNFATLQMREKVDLIKRVFPEDVNTPQVLKFDPASIPVFKLAISGGYNLVDLRRTVEDNIKPQLERQEGVASVSISGGKIREIQIQVDEGKLANLGLGLNQLTQTLTAENMDFSSGSIREGSEELLIRVQGTYQEIDEIENLPLVTKTGNVILLKEIAQVKDTYEKATKTSTMNGVPSIGIDIMKQTDANTVVVSDQILEAIDKMKAELPENVEIKIIFDQAQYINQSIDNVTSNTVVGGFLAVAILYLFLRNFRSTLVISLAIPISIIATFTLIYFSGLTLNMLSLGGLALGVGMMVDSAIVVLENIFRYRQEGLGPVEAASKGAAEVGDAVISGALTTVVVFLPIVFVEGLAAELFRPLALTVSFSNLAALLVALTLVPVLSSKLLNVEVKTNKKKVSRRLIDRFGSLLDGLSDRYEKLLRSAINKRKTVIISVTIAFFGSIALVPFIGTEFIPKMDQGELQINVTLPNGALLTETNEIVSRIETQLKDIKEIDTVFTSVGSGGAMDFMGRAQTNIANLHLKLVDLDQRKRSTEKVADEIRIIATNIAGADIEVAEIESGGMGMAAPLEITISGDDLGVLKDLSNSVIQEAQKVEGVRGLESSLNKGIPELIIDVDKDRAAMFGLNSAAIAASARAAFQGDVATRFKTGSDEINVKVMVGDSENKTLQNVKNLQLITPTGSTVLLEEVAEVKIIEGPSSINRKAQIREVTVSGSITERDLGSIIKDLEAKLDTLPLPDGYDIEYGGQSKEMVDAFGDLTLALILAIILVYMIMAAQFEALMQPFIIMFSLPVTFIGIVIGLLVTGRALSVPAFIGVIMLAGIVVNNAIVLVDYINTLRQEGLTREEAILKAGPVRLRPILMTTLTSVLGLVPLTLGIGEGAEVQAPMATVVAFGLTFSTLITLVLVPVVYIIFDDLGSKFKSKMKTAFRRDAV